MATIPDLHSVWDSSAKYIEDISNAQHSKRDKLKHYSVVTMVYKSAKCATLLGGLLTVKIMPDSMHFLISQVLDYFTLNLLTIMHQKLLGTP